MTKFFFRDKRLTHDQACPNLVLKVSPSVAASEVPFELRRGGDQNARAITAIAGLGTAVAGRSCEIDQRRRIASYLQALWVLASADSDSEIASIGLKVKSGLVNFEELTRLAPSITPRMWKHAKMTKWTHGSPDGQHFKQTILIYTNTDMQLAFVAHYI